MWRAVLGGGLEHWQILPGAVAAGLTLGAAVLAALYLAPILRLRLADDEEGRARVLRGELGRLRRLGDAAAVLEEHGHPEAKELRTEVELRSLLLAMGARGCVRAREEEADG